MSGSPAKCLTKRWLGATIHLWLPLTLAVLFFLQQELATGAVLFGVVSRHPLGYKLAFD